jgi:hypothetical protein
MVNVRCSGPGCCSGDGQPARQGQQVRSGGSVYAGVRRGGHRCSVLGRGGGVPGRAGCGVGGAGEGAGQRVQVGQHVGQDVAERSIPVRQASGADRTAPGRRRAARSGPGRRPAGAAPRCRRRGRGGCGAAGAPGQRPAEGSRPAGRRARQNPPRVPQQPERPHARLAPSTAVAAQAPTAGTSPKSRLLCGKCSSTAFAERCEPFQPSRDAARRGVGDDVLEDSAVDVGGEGFSRTRR